MDTRRVQTGRQQQQQQSLSTSLSHTKGIRYTAALQKNVAYDRIYTARFNMMERARTKNVTTLVRTNRRKMKTVYGLSSVYCNNVDSVLDIIYQLIIIQ